MIVLRKIEKAKLELEMEKESEDQEDHLQIKLPRSEGRHSNEI